MYCICVKEKISQTSWICSIENELITQNRKCNSTMRTITLFLKMLHIAFNVQATDYYSTEDGDWSDHIWSRTGHNDLTNLITLDGQNLQNPNASEK